MGPDLAALRTARLVLRPWPARHRDAFARMNADAEVMADFGAPLGRAESDAKFDRYAAAWRDHGIARWAVEDEAEQFIGYCGIMPCLAGDHPLGRHHEIGWRFVRAAWGHGYATESARAALDHGFARFGFEEVLACTAPDNRRSRAVMARLGLERMAGRDFTLADDGAGRWHAQVWRASPERRPFDGTAGDRNAAPLPS